MKKQIPTLLVIFSVIAIFLYFMSNPKKESNSANTKKPRPKKKITFKDLAPNKKQKFQIKSKGLKPTKKAKAKKSNISFSVSPTDDFYKAAKDAKYDIKKTIKAINVKKLPVKGQVNIVF